ncbi:MAG: filamentous hemagglutinin N-terminal domain-containing protein, partial [Pseudomonadales bacterium]|nr:filamentous hemagglutinin N-terminal domain-containing protein [Pseudomonadales bacterium]
MSRPPVALFRKSLLASAIAGLVCTPAAPVLGNPSGADVVRGTVDFQSFGNELTITNTPGAIIDWQDFSIAHDEITRFQQQAANSAVLNRVVGGELSEIMGQLVSNGQVFLINPNGVVFGQDVTIDTAGFVASTLDIANEDFLTGNYTFQDGGSAGRIVNEGYLATRGGNVFFVASDIENSGIIHTEDGSLVLAAGERVRIRSLDEPDIEFEVASAENEILNLGALLAEQGAVRAFAGTLRHSGEVRADSVRLDADGSVVLFAEQDLTLEAGSTVTASGVEGGDVLVQSAAGDVLASGEIRAEGVEGTGGRIRLLGDRVGVLDEGVISADGAFGGGEILVGGNLQGLGPEPNANAVFVGADTDVTASATVNGDGGTVIAFGEELLRLQGTLRANGGLEGGDGGFVETSARTGLEIDAAPDVSAPAGEGGTWLIDPVGIRIIDGPGVNPPDGSPTPPSTIFSGSTGVNELDVGAIDAGFAGGASTVIVDATGGGAGAEGIEWTAGATLDLSDNTAAGSTLQLVAPEEILFEGAINDPNGNLQFLQFYADGPITVTGGGAGNQIFAPDATLEVRDAGGQAPAPLDLDGGDISVGLLDADGLFAASGSASFLEASSGGSLFFLDVGDGALLDLGITPSLSVGSALLDGTLAGTGTLLQFGEASVSLSSGSAATLDGVVLEGDSGTSFLFSNTTTMTNGASVESAFNVLLEAGSRVLGDGTEGGITLTAGNLIVAPGATADLAVPLVNQAGGNVVVGDGTLILRGGGSSAGNVTLGDGSVGIGILSIENAAESFQLLDTATVTQLAPLQAFVTVNGGVLDMQNATQAVAVPNLSLSAGGAVTGPGRVVVTDTFDWTSGSLGAAGSTGTLEVQGTGNIDTTVGKTINADYTLEVSGALSWNESNIVMNDDSRILVAEGGVFDFNLDNSRFIGFGSGAPALIVDTAGTINDGGTARAVIDVRLENSGSVNASGFDLAFTRGGLSSGSFEVSAGAELSFGAATGSGGHQIDGSIGGSGTVDFESGTGLDATVITSSGDLAVPGTTRISGGTVAINTPVDAITGTLELVSGRLEGGSVLQVGNGMTWSAGAMGGTGTTRLLSGSTSSIAGTLTKSMSDDRTLLNEGTLSWNDGSIVLNDNAVLQNDDILNVSLIATRTLDQGTLGTQAFVNNGTLNKDQPNTANIDVATTLGGSVVITDGTLILTRSSTTAATADVNIDAPGILRYSGLGPHTLEAGANFTGTGFVEAVGPVLVDAGAPVTMAALRLDPGGTIAGDGTLVVDTDFEWRGGTIGQIGSVGTVEIATPTGAISTGSFKTISGDHTLLLTGFLDWQDGNIIMRETSELQIAVGGAFNSLLTTARTLDFGSGAPLIQNAGTIRNLGSALATIDVRTDNIGSVVGSGAEMRFTRGGTHTGSFTTDVGSAIAFGGSGADFHTLNGTASGLGAFRFLNTGNTTTVVNGSYDVGTTDVDGGAVNFDGPTLTDTLIVGGGTLGGAGTVDVSSQLLWNAGTMGGAGTTRVDAAATGSIATSGTKLLRDGRVFRNDGNLTWTDGSIVMGETALFDNRSDLLVDLVSVRVLDLNSGTPAFLNTGTIDQSGASLIIDVDSDIGGSVNVNASAGVLRFTRGGTYAAAFDLQNVGVDNVRFEGFTDHLLASGVGFTGPGFLDIAQGTTRVAGGVTVLTDNLRLSGGTLAGDGEVSIRTAGIWEAGSVGATGENGTLTVSPGATLTLSSANTKQLRGGATLLNEGTIVWQDGSALLNENAVLQNDGLFDVQLLTSSRVLDFSGGTPQFNSTGAISKSASAFTFTIDVPSSVQGTVDVTAGQIDFTRSSNQQALYTIGTGALVRLLGGGTHLLQNGVDFAGAGLVSLDSSATQIETGATVAVDNLRIEGGTLLGDGTLRIDDQGEFLAGTIGDAGNTTNVLVAPTALFEISGPLVKRIEGAGIFENDGTLRWTDGTIVMQGTPTLRNDNLMFIDLTTTNRSLSNSGIGAPLFQNLGSLTKSASTNLLNVEVAVDMQNTVTVGAGGINFRAGGTHGAAYDVGTGAEVFFNGGVHQLNAGIDLAGAGQFSMSGTSTEVVIDAGVTVPVSNFRKSAGTLRGAGTMLLTGAGELSGGAIGAQGVATNFTVESTATLDFAGPTLLRGDGTFSSAGTMRWLASNITLADNMTFENAGTFDIELASAGTLSDASIGAFFRNTGVIEQTTATDTTTFDVQFDNDGLVSISSGELSLSRSGTHSGDFDILGGLLSFGGGGTANGSTFFVDQPGTLEFLAPFTLANGATLTGPGQVLGSQFLDFGAGEVLLDMPITLIDEDVDSSGFIRITDVVTVLGTVNFLGSVLNQGTIDVVGSAQNGNALATFFDLDNQGVVQLTNDSLNANASIDVQGSFTNDGVIRTLLGAGGGVRTMRGDLRNLSGALEFAAGTGTLLLSGAQGISFEGTGSVNIGDNANAAVLLADQQGSAASFQIQDSATIQIGSGGSLAVRNNQNLTPALFTWNGGTVGGSGSFDIRDTIPTFGTG